MDRSPRLDDVRIDLHAHSTASDGTDSPAELVTAAAAAGLDVVALTDHDTTSGWAEALDALPAGLRLVRGAEFSCVAPDGGSSGGRSSGGGTVSVHLLGYLFDPACPAIVAEQRRLGEERRARLRTMAARMAEDGFPVDPDALLAGLPPRAQAGRPHLARALVAAGVVDSVDDAFRRYLSTGGRYYTGRADTDVVTAIRMVREAGGVPVLAHPFARSRGPVVDAGVITELVDEGLAGVEADHPDHVDEDRSALRELADKLDLLVTGSSDYHGTNKTVRLGRHTTDPRSLDQIEKLAADSGVPVLTGAAG
jgi:hypothetical protein